MKSKLLIVLLALPIFIAGCVGPQSAPTAWEQKFFDVETNYAPKIVVVTNTVVKPDPVTQIPVTNYTVVLATNNIPEYVFSRNTNADETANLVGNILNIAAPGIGSIFVAAIGGLFGLYGTLRSRKSNQTAAALAQIIETGDQVLLSLPNGPALAEQWKAWMVKHQAETGTIAQAANLVANIVDTEDARKAAAQITALISRK